MLKKFECPCHGAKFNRYGEVLEGPPPRPLDLYRLQIVEEKLVIDMGNPIERKRFEPSQVIKI
jgi:Rieske Fe-S protein